MVLLYSSLHYPVDDGSKHVLDVLKKLTFPRVPASESFD